MPLPAKINKAKYDSVSRAAEKLDNPDQEESECLISKVPEKKKESKKSQDILNKITSFFKIEKK